MEQIFKKVNPELERGNVVCINLVVMGLNALVKDVVKENVVLEILTHNEKGHRVGTGKEITVMGYKRFDYWILPSQT